MERETKVYTENELKDLGIDFIKDECYTSALTIIEQLIIIRRNKRR